LECVEDYYLDLKSYECVEECPRNSIAIEADNTYMGRGFRFCRPYRRNTVTYYVAEEGDNEFEAGTEEFPFTNLVFGMMEVFNNPTLFEDFDIVIKLSS